MKLIDIIKPYKEQIHKIEIQFWTEKHKGTCSGDPCTWHDEYDTLWITFKDKSLLGLDFLYDIGCDFGGEGFMAEQIKRLNGKTRYDATKTAISYKIKKIADKNIDLDEIGLSDFDEIKDWFYGVEA